MTFWDYLDQNPFWTLLFLLVIATMMPTVSVRWWRGEKPKGEA